MSVTSSWRKHPLIASDTKDRTEQSIKEAKKMKKNGITFNPVIGISGKAQHGKDTVTDCIADTVRTLAVLMDGMIGSPAYLSVRRIGFADAVKDEAKSQGWNGLKDEAGRSMLQKIGSVRRVEDPDYWVKKCFEKIVQEDQRNTLWIVPDVRYKNEADYIRDQGGVIWRVNRVGIGGGPFVNGLTIEQQAHPSETDLDNYEFDAVFMNHSLAITKGRVRDQINGIVDAHIPKAR